MPGRVCVKTNITTPTTIIPNPIKNQILETAVDKSITAPVVEKGCIIIIKSPIVINKKPIDFNPLLKFMILLMIWIIKTLLSIFVTTAKFLQPKDLNTGFYYKN